MVKFMLDVRLLFYLINSLVFLYEFIKNPEFFHYCQKFPNIN